MTRYLIDIRLMGSVRRQIRELGDRLQETFGIRPVAPHITLAGPFSTAEEERLVADFTRVCTEEDNIPRYDVGGYGFFDDTRVVYVTILPDNALREFRYRLSRAIAPYCDMRQYDHDAAGDFLFHATLAMKLDWLTFQRIKWYFRNQENVVWHHHPIRATLLRNTRILCEYDFVQRRMLSRAQALSRATMTRDLRILMLQNDDENR